MTKRRTVGPMAAALAVAACCWISLPAWAHVYLEAPQDGEAVPAGEAYQVEWAISVYHGPPDIYDLLYSSDGGEHFEVLLEGVAADVNSYIWSVPTDPAANAELVIVQHGADDYTYMNVVTFSVLTGVSDDVGPDPAPDVGAPDVGMGHDTGFDIVDAPDAADAGGDVVTDLHDGPDLHDVGSDAPEMRSMPDATTAVDAANERPPETAEEVLTLFEGRCALSGCHSGPNPQARLELTANAFPTNLVGARSTVTSGAIRVDPCSPETSELIARVRGERATRMPPRPEEPLSAATIHQLEHWIEDGAPASGPIEGHVADCRPTGGSGSGCAVAGAPNDWAGSAWWLLVTGLLVVGRRRAVTPSRI